MLQQMEAAFLMHFVCIQVFCQSAGQLADWAGLVRELCALQGPVPPSFLLLVVDVTEVDHVLLEPDKRAVWHKQTSTRGGNSGHSWHKQDVNP